MPAIYAELTPPLAQLEAMTVRTAQSPAIMATLHKRSMTRLGQRAVTVLKVEPAARDTTGIARLMTPRQRRKVHAMRRERGGGDYSRTHGISLGWKYKVNALPAGGEVVVYNEAQGVGWVEGWDQQPFLAALGWLYAPPVLAEFSAEAEAITVQNFNTAFDIYAGVPR